MGLHRVLTNQGYLIKKDQITKEQDKLIKTELNVTPIVFKAYQDFVKPKPFKIYQESPNYYFLPKFWAQKNFGPPLKNKIPEGLPMAKGLKVIYDLLPHQETAYQKTMETMHKVGGGILSLPCGMGKTFLGIKTACDLGVCTLVLVNKEFLMDQWIDSIKKFTDGKARIGIIQQNKVQVKDKDFVIGMVHSVCKKDYPKGTFDVFGLCIMDEVHHLASEMFSQALPKVASKYMLGLSATPRRKDGLARVFHYYIGDVFHSEKRTGTNKVIVKRLQLTSSTSYYETLFMSNGTKNTGGMTTNLANYEVRTQLILKCIRILMKQDRKILVLSGRRKHLHDLYDLLNNSNIKTVHNKPITFGYYYGNQGKSKAIHRQMLEQSAKCDIVLGTYDIASEGLDIPGLNTELMITSYCDVEQSVGRILRKFHKKINPLVVDFVDHCGNFQNHGKIRKKYYEEEDYTVEDLDLPLGHNYQELSPFFEELGEYLLSPPPESAKPNIRLKSNVNVKKPNPKVKRPVIEKKPTIRSFQNEGKCIL